MATFTGPFALFVGSHNHYRAQLIYKQKRPYKDPLPYVTTFAHCLIRSGLEGQTPTSGLPASTIANLVYNVGSVENDVISRCYDKIKGSISERAELAVAAMESRKSLTMIYQRSRQLLGSVEALRRGNWKLAAKILERPDSKGGKTSKVKSVANNWLEVVYGWLPSIMDIGNAINVLQEPFKKTRVAESVRGSYRVIDTKPDWPFGRGLRYKVQPVCKMGCEIEVSNPNLWLANQMGFINPASWLWELTTLSFVVDWFTNVGQFLASATDFLGLTIHRAYTTLHYANGTASAYWGGGIDGSHVGASNFTFGRTTRTLGLTKPALFIRPIWITGWRRAANAVALLVVGMKSLR